MSKSNNKEFESSPEPRFRNRYRFAAMLSLMLGLTLLLLMCAYYIFYPIGAIYASPLQPIPFSHRVHVTDKTISCFFCHSTAMKSDRAEIPAVEKCMLCHSKVAIHLPAISRLREHYYQNKPVIWERTLNISEFVYFSHQAHIQSGIDCGKCHGDIAHMDRVAVVYQINMGFCITCHRQENASRDCYVCHR